MTKPLTNRKARRFIDNREPFTAYSFSGYQRWPWYIIQAYDGFVLYMCDLRTGNWYENKTTDTVKRYKQREEAKPPVAPVKSYFKREIDMLLQGGFLQAESTFDPSKPNPYVEHKRYIEGRGLYKNLRAGEKYQ